MIQSIRDMRSSDVPVVLGFYEEAFGINFPGADFERIKRAAKRRILGTMPADSGEVILVAEGPGDLIIAYVWLALGRSGDGEPMVTIEGFGVHDEYRRQGVGAFMAEAIQQWAFRLWGVKRLQCLVSLDNEPVIGLLEKMGGQARFVTYVKDVE